MNDPTRDEINAIIKASEAGTETKIARLEGKIDTLATMLLGRLDALRDDVRKSDEYNRTTRWMLFGTFLAGIFAIAALIIDMATYGDSLFGRGMNVRDVVQSVIKEQQEMLQRREEAPAARPNR
jgi:hypothetical protein